MLIGLEQHHLQGLRIGDDFVTTPRQTFVVCLGFPMARIPFGSGTEL
jgi:hypothetical protein